MDIRQQSFLDLAGTVRTLDLRAIPRDLDEFAGPSYSPHLNERLRDFVVEQANARNVYPLDPFSEHISAGKNTYVYDAHTYHTKVPPEAIVPLIEHYTEPGDLVLDPFSGSGMMGVAALRSNRKPILIDLSPAATFISVNFLTPIDAKVYWRAIQDILVESADEELALYGTHCRSCGKLVPLEYMVWSYGLICKHCKREFLLWDVALDEKPSVRESKVRTEFNCPHCGKHIQKRILQRTRMYPVQVGYRCCKSGPQESKAAPDAYDLALIDKIESEGVPTELWYPSYSLPAGMNTQQPIAQGTTSVRDLYSTRSLRSVARLWDVARRGGDPALALKLMFTVTSLYQRVTKLPEFRFWGGSGNIANYNVPMISNEQNVFKVFKRKAKTISSYFETWDSIPQIPFCISTQSATDLTRIPDASIDYIFTDPPFGGNINYSEMNFLWEAWLAIFTDSKNEAIVNRVQKKSISEYRELMTQAFREMHRVLKPGKWLTVVFHNSSADVWAALQAALLDGGFSIASAQMLDKRHGTFKQFVSENAVAYDLTLHCRSGTSISANVSYRAREKTARENVYDFLARTWKNNPDEFVVHYLHVRRDDELDARKLYSLWLKDQLEANRSVSWGYEDFRSLVSKFLSEQKSQPLEKVAKE